MQSQPCLCRYYSSGSMSFITPELWAFFSLYDEVRSLFNTISHSRIIAEPQPRGLAFLL